MASELEGKREGYRLALLDLEQEYRESERIKAAQRDTSAEAKSKSPDSSPVEQAPAEIGPSEHSVPDGQDAADPPTETAISVSDGRFPSPPLAQAMVDTPRALGPSAEAAGDAVGRPVSPFFSPTTPPGKEMASLSPERRDPSPALDQRPPTEDDPLDMRRLRGSLPARPAAGSPDAADESHELASHVSATPEDDVHAMGGPPLPTGEPEGPVTHRTSQQAPIAAHPSEEEVARQTQATPSSSSSSGLPGVLSVSRRLSSPMEVHDSSDDEADARTDSDELDLFKDDDDRGPPTKRRAHSPAGGEAGGESSGRPQTKRHKLSYPSVSDFPAVLRFSKTSGHGASPSLSSQPAAKEARYTADTGGVPPGSSHGRPPKRKDGREAALPAGPEVVELTDEDNSDDSSVHAIEGGGRGRRLSTEV
jgi:hypothetical protein